MIPLTPSEDDEIKRFKAEQFKKRYPNANLPPPNPNRYTLSAPADDDENPRFNQPGTLEQYLETQEVYRVLFETEEAQLIASNQEDRFQPVFGSKQKKFLKLKDIYDKDDDYENSPPTPKNFHGGDPPTAGMAKPKEKPKLEYNPYS